mgnify:FL=1
MNKKGFTMVELLAVLILLGVLAIIAIPAINSTINSSKEKAKTVQKEIIIKAAHSYVAENRNDIAMDEATYIPVSELIVQKYIDGSNEENIASSEFADSCVIVEFDNKYNQFEYNVVECEK